MGMFDDMLDEGMHRTQVVMQETGLSYEEARRVVTGQDPHPKEKPKMKIYIAGPMRGYPWHNFPAFYDMETWLRAKGYETLNPARADDETGVPPGSIGVADALTRDAAMVASADAIYMLAGWENSAGALVEWQLAKALGLQIFYQAGIEDYEWKEHFDGAGTAVTQ